MGSAEAARQMIEAILWFSIGYFGRPFSNRWWPDA